MIAINTGNMAKKNNRKFISSCTFIGLEQMYINERSMYTKIFKKVTSMSILFAKILFFLNIT